MFGFCSVSIAPLRAEASDRSEQVSQMLLGETFKIIEKRDKWLKVETFLDAYQGWIDVKQQTHLTEEQYNQLNEDKFCSGDLVEFLSNPSGDLLPIPLGTSLGFLKSKELNPKGWQFDGVSVDGSLNKNAVLNKAFLYMHAPYLWGGRSPFGIDCSGFTQMVYKLCGYNLPRDAYQQANHGEVLSFIEESEPGDLAFFDNEEGKITHVGIMMKDNYIIHASGQVRIDRLDHLGIFNADTNRHTHRLRVIKKIL